MVNTGEELANIALENIKITARELLNTAQCAVGALTHPVGERVGDEGALKHGFNYIAQGVVYHPVAKGRGRNQSPLWLMNIETTIISGVIGPLTQFRLQPQKVVLKIMLEKRDIWSTSFPFTRLAIGQKEILP